MLLNLSSVPHYCTWPDAKWMPVNKHFKQEMQTACPCIETAKNPLTNELSLHHVCVLEKCVKHAPQMLWRQLGFVLTKCKVATCHEPLDTRDSNFYLQIFDRLHQSDTKGNTDAKHYIKVINPQCARIESAIIQLEALGTCDWCHSLPFHLVGMLHHQVTRHNKNNSSQLRFLDHILQGCNLWMCVQWMVQQKTPNTRDNNKFVIYSLVMHLSNVQKGHLEWFNIN